MTAATTVAELHAIVQTVCGWSGEYLHRFVIGGAEHGIYQAFPQSRRGHPIAQLCADRERPLTCELLEPPVGIEPTTYALRVRCSGRLS